MLVPSFTLELNHKLLAGLVTIGCYDGQHPCLTASTTSDKVSKLTVSMIPPLPPPPLIKLVTVS